MSKVLVTKNKIDLLANAISAKSGESLTLTIDEMIEAVDGIETGGGTPNLQAKSYTVNSAGTETIEADSGYDGLSEVELTVPDASPYVDVIDGDFTTINGQRKWLVKGQAVISDYDGWDAGWIDETIYGEYINYNALAYGTTVTPTESSQTIGGYKTMMEGPVTVSAISSSYVGSGIIRRDNTDLTASGDTVSVPSGYYASNVSKAVASGSISNQAWSRTKGASYMNVYHAVNKTEGYISGGVQAFNYDLFTLEDKIVTPSTSSQTVTPTSDAYYLNSVTVEAMPSGSTTGPSSLSGSSATITTGTNTITLTKTGVTTTPTVSAGYVSNATASTATVALTASVTTKAAATITPTTTNQTIASGTYLTGTQTISGDANLVAGNIKKNVSIFGVNGSYEGSGSGSVVVSDQANSTGTTAVVTADDVTTLTTKNITQNGTYTASADGVDGYSSVTVSVSGGGSVIQDQDGYIVLPPTGGSTPSVSGLVYETGTWNPSTDTNNQWISFNNTHDALPLYVSMEDSDPSTITTAATFGWCCINLYSSYGEPTYTHYGMCNRRYTDSNVAWTTNTANITATGDPSSVIANYVTTTEFRANGTNTSYYWRAGRTYKWIAVWAPTT